MCLDPTALWVLSGCHLGFQWPRRLRARSGLCREESRAQPWLSSPHRAGFGVPRRQRPHCPSPVLADDGRVLRLVLPAPRGRAEPQTAANGGSSDPLQGHAALLDVPGFGRHRQSWEGITLLARARGLLWPRLSLSGNGSLGKTLGMFLPAARSVFNRKGRVPSRQGLCLWVGTEVQLAPCCVTALWGVFNAVLDVDYALPPPFS